MGKPLRLPNETIGESARRQCGVHYILTTQAAAQRSAVELRDHGNVPRERTEARAAVSRTVACLDQNGDPPLGKRALHLIEARDKRPSAARQPEKIQRPRGQLPLDLVDQIGCHGDRPAGSAGEQAALAGFLQRGTLGSNP